MSIHSKDPTFVCLVLRIDRAHALKFVATTELVYQVEVADLDPLRLLLGGAVLLAVRGGSFERALTLHGAASSISRASGPRRAGPAPPAWPWVATGRELAALEHVPWIAAARRSLGRAAADSAWRVGAAMTAAQAVAYALYDGSEPPVPGGPLTSREKEIATLVARGHRSREIAERLTISRRTVDSHVEHIRNKLGHQSRAQVAAWATAEGLIEN